MDNEFTILVGDDDVVSRRVVQKPLEKAGFSVVTVANGQNALDLFDRQFFPIVLTDWMMPGIDGFEVCRDLRRSGSKTQIVMLTAKGEEPELVRKGLPDDPNPDQSRYIEADVKGLRVASIYLPNGNPAPGPKFDYKLAWMARLEDRAKALLADVQDIVDNVGTSQSNISQHLAILRDKDILATRKDANRVYYKISDPRLLQLIGMMREVFCTRHD